MSRVRPGSSGREYERQQAAWKKVEQCRSDGGSDCMQYSATNTADGSNNNTTTPNGQAKPEGDPSQSASSGMPVWLWGYSHGRDNRPGGVSAA